jgi:hypothetical protein
MAADQQDEKENQLQKFYSYFNAQMRGKCSYRSLSNIITHDS